MRDPVKEKFANRRLPGTVVCVNGVVSVRNAQISSPFVDNPVMQSFVLTLKLRITAPLVAATLKTVLDPPALTHRVPVVLSNVSPSRVSPPGQGGSPPDRFNENRGVNAPVVLSTV
jgi:hypothetical protein